MEYNFNPRSHERSDEEGKEQERYLQISIHAPTRGATTARVRRYCKLSISIHAPTRGATAWRRSNALHHVHFNPRSHERSDADPDLQGGTMTKISIHAPTRGATKVKKVFRRILKFQSTLPREERLNLTCYNLWRTIISIHAPTRGATDTVAVPVKWSSISIHAPTRGATVFENNML